MIRGMPRSSVVARLVLGVMVAGCGGASQGAAAARPSGPVLAASTPPSASSTASAPVLAAPSPLPASPPPALPPPASTTLAAAPSPSQISSTRTALRQALAVARTRQIARLRAYREAGRFPVYVTPFGHALAHRLTRSPLFVDQNGTPCAVGYLMQRAGWGAEVAAIAAADATVHIEEVTSGPIVEWVLRSGLTQDEATLIQPDYQVIHARLVRELARDRKRLKAHFLAVEKQLITTTEVSLDIATVRLLPAMLAGGSLVELADRAPAAAPPPGA